MRIRITAHIHFPNGSTLGIRTDECEYYHYYSDTTAYHTISIYNQMLTESYPKGNYEMRFDTFRKVFRHAQLHMYVKCALQGGLSESEVESFKGGATFDMVEDNGYIATVFVYPDNPDWAVPAAHKKFGTRKDANNYVLNNIINHDWFDYYNPLEQSGGKS